MRNFIFTTLLMTSNLFAQEVDWKKLNEEMTYLKNNAFLEQKAKAITAKEDELKEDNSASSIAESLEQESNSYSLKRKPIRPNHKSDPNIIPLEEQYFDNVDFKMAAPKRTIEPQDESKEQPVSSEKKFYKIDGAIPVLDLEE